MALFDFLIAFLAKPSFTDSGSVPHGKRSRQLISCDRPGHIESMYDLLSAYPVVRPNLVEHSY